jgi:hypothetical protein
MLLNAFTRTPARHFAVKEVHSSTIHLQQPPLSRASGLGDDQLEKRFAQHIADKALQLTKRRGEVLVGAWPAVAQRNTNGAKLGLEVSGADAEDQSTVLLKDWPEGVPG